MAWKDNYEWSMFEHDATLLMEEVKDPDADTPTDNLATLPAIAADSFSVMQMDVNAAVITPMPKCCSFVEYFVLASRLVWSIDELWPMQLDALLRLFNPSKTKKKLLYVQRTGGGKAHVIIMIGTLLKGIHLIVHPSLALLTADQV